MNQTINTNIKKILMSLFKILRKFMMKLGYLREEFNNLYFQIKHKFLLGLFGNDSIIMDNYISKINCYFMS